MNWDTQVCCSIALLHQKRNHRTVPAPLQRSSDREDLLCAGKSIAIVSLE